MKQLYVVELKTEIIVLADDKDEAEDLAKEASYDLSNYDYDHYVSEMTYLPGDWDIQSIPYGDRDDEDPDRTIEKWIELGAAPKYKAQKVEK